MSALIVFCPYKCVHLKIIYCLYVIVFIQWFDLNKVLFCVWFASLQGSSVCSSYQEDLWVLMVGQVPPCTLLPTICVSQVHHRVECPQLSQDIMDSRTPPWCSHSYRDRLVRAPWFHCREIDEIQKLFGDSSYGWLLFLVSHICCC